MYGSANIINGFGLVADGTAYDGSYAATRLNANDLRIDFTINGVTRSYTDTAQRVQLRYLRAAKIGNDTAMVAISNILHVHLLQFRRRLFPSLHHVDRMLRDRALLRRNADRIWYHPPKLGVGQGLRNRNRWNLGRTSRLRHRWTGGGLATAAFAKAMVRVSKSSSYAVTGF